MHCTLGIWRWRGSRRRRQVETRVAEWAACARAHSVPSVCANHSAVWAHPQARQQHQSASLVRPPLRFSLQALPGPLCACICFSSLWKSQKEAIPFWSNPRSSASSRFLSAICVSLSISMLLCLFFLSPSRSLSPCSFFLCLFTFPLSLLSRYLSISSIVVPFLLQCAPHMFCASRWGF